MRLLSLTIENVRGIREETFPLDGKSTVIWGPNGSGKSSIVDAIDFLFTGRISRLEGPGTMGISMRLHGHHIDRDLKSAVVKASVELTGFEDAVVISRCMDQPEELDCPAAARTAIAAVGTNIRNGRMILTRQDILNYVTAEASKRADEIQAILNLKEIDVIRDSLQRANTEMQRKEDKTGNAVKIAVADVCTLLNSSDFSDELLLDVVNAHRQTLGGDAIEVAHSGNLKHSLSPPNSRVNGRKPFNSVLFDQNMQQLLRSIHPDDLTGRVESHENLRACVSDLKTNVQLLEELKRLELTRQAMYFVDESTTVCPVCGAIWSEGHLKEHLTLKMVAAKTAEEAKLKISELSEELAAPVRNSLANLEYVSKDISESRLKDQFTKDLETLHSWLSELQELMESLRDPIEKYLGSRFTSFDIARLLAPQGVGELLDRVNTSLQSETSKPGPEQTAWDTLTRLEERLGALEKRKDDNVKACLSRARSEALFDTYKSVQDSKLEGLYSKIENRFKEFYRMLHEDEEEFSARLHSSGPSLDFKVNFLGRGFNPPHALHSEGHQGSMGLCLFLALSEKVAAGRSNLVVLDDVIMSIDGNHRKEICGLLVQEFPGRQFIITTHDKTWARQLRQHRVVDSNQLIELTGWTIKDGPRINRRLNLWEEIEEALHNEDIGEASFKLRKDCENFFENVCSALVAHVPYNSNMQWQLDDWLFPAMRKYKDLLKKATKSARRWGRQPLIDELTNLESTRLQIYNRISEEQWAMNASIHHNNWENLYMKELKVLVEAFRDLRGLFVCSCCGGFLKLIPPKGNDQVLKCHCGKVNWPL